MGEPEKHKLFLLPGEQALDARALAALFKAISGREATPKEIEEAQKELDSFNRSHHDEKNSFDPARQ